MATTTPSPKMMTVYYSTRPVQIAVYRISRDELDSTPTCDSCSNRRDAWATAQELRHMAKAVLTADLLKVKDIA